MARKTRNGVMGKRTIGLAAIGTLVGAGAAIFAALKLRKSQDIGHEAPDLAPQSDRPGPGDRAPDAFRPDPAAPVPASEREALRPVTTPVPASTDRESVALS